MTIEPKIFEFYEADSLSPKASACFFAFNRRSAMLEFLLWAAANAAKFNGYCGMENSPLPPFIAAAYWKWDWKNLYYKNVQIYFIRKREINQHTWCATDSNAGSNAENAAATAAPDEYWCGVVVAVVMLGARIDGRFT